MSRKVLGRIGVYERSFQVFLILVVCDGAVFIELVENVFLTGLVVGTSVNYYRLLGIVVLVVDNERTVFLRALRDSCENSRLGDSEVVNVLAEVFQRSELNAVVSSAEADIVEVLFEYLVL